MATKRKASNKAGKKKGAKKKTAAARKKVGKAGSNVIRKPQ